MNNAGVMALPERSLTPNGIETQMGTNHMGHFYLTSKMMPTILSTPGLGLGHLRLRATFTSPHVLSTCISHEMTFRAIPASRPPGPE